MPFNLGLTVRYLRKRRLESFLVVLTMSIGIAVLTTVLVAYFGFNRQLNAYLDDVHYRLFTVTGQSAQKSPIFRLNPPIRPDMDAPAPSLDVSTQDLDQIQEDLPEGMTVFPMRESFLQINRPRQIELAVIGTKVGFNEFYRLPLISGNWFMNDDLQKGSFVVVLSSQAAQYLFGTDNPLGQKVSFDDTHGSGEYTVIGVLDKNAGEMRAYNPGGQRLVAYVPFASAFSPDSSLSSFFVGIDSGMNLSKALEQIRGVINLHLGGEAYVTSNLLELQEDLSSITPILRSVGIFASIGLVIAVINILNLMLARVLRRVKHAGIHMALGSSRRSIFLQFFSEALLLGLLSSFFGMIISHFAELWLQNVWSVALPPTPFLVRILVSLGIGLLASTMFGVYPALQIVRINLGQALRAEVGGV